MPPSFDGPPGPGVQRLDRVRGADHGVSECSRPQVAAYADAGLLCSHLGRHRSRRSWSGCTCSSLSSAPSTGWERCGKAMPTATPHCTIRSLTASSLSWPICSRRPDYRARWSRNRGVRAHPGRRRSSCLDRSGPRLRRPPRRDVSGHRAPSTSTTRRKLQLALMNPVSADVIHCHLADGSGRTPNAGRTNS